MFGYDVRPEVREQVQSLGAKFVEFDIGESGTGTGGYAKQLSPAARNKQQQMLTEELKKADIIISTALVPCMPAPVLITEESVTGMHDGAVIVDMAAATGGNCPLTEPDQVVIKHGVVICGYTNFPALMPSDASSFFARNLFNFVQLIVDPNGAAPKFRDFLADEISAMMLITHQGKVRFEAKKSA